MNDPDIQNTIIGWLTRKEREVIKNAIRRSIGEPEKDYDDA